MIKNIPLKPRLILLEDKIINTGLVLCFNYSTDKLIINIEYSSGLKDTIRFPTNDAFMNGLKRLSSYAR